MAGPFLRILTQVVLASANVVSKAFMQAYAEAAKDGGKAAAAAAARANVRSMPRDQARQVLNFEASEALTKDLVLERYRKYFKVNDPAAGGSLYVQCKVYHAKEALMDELDVPVEEREFEDEQPQADPKKVASNEDEAAASSSRQERAP